MLLDVLDGAVDFIVDGTVVTYPAGLGGVSGLGGGALRIRVLVVGIISVTGVVGPIGLGLGIRRIDRGGGNARRLIAQRARYAHGEIAVALVRRAGLLAAYGGLVRRLVGAVALRGLFPLREVDLRGHLRAYVLGADDRRQDRLDALGVLVLEIIDVIELAAIQLVGVAVGAAQQIAVLIDDGNVVDGQLRHAAGDHVDDGIDLAFAQYPTRLQVEDDGGGGGFALADEDGRLGHGEVNAGPLDAAQRADGAGQFALQSALVVDLFGELADAECLVIHQLEADAAGFGQPLFGQPETSLADLIGRNEQGLAALAELVGDAHGIELGDDSTAVGVGQCRIENPIFRAASPQQQGDHDSHGGGAGYDQRDTGVPLQSVQPVAAAGGRLRSGLAIRIPGGCIG